jgi:hypothetical protein
MTRSLCISQKGGDCSFGEWVLSEAILFSHDNHCEDTTVCLQKPTFPDRSILVLKSSLLKHHLQCPTPLESMTQEYPEMTVHSNNPSSVRGEREAPWAPLPTSQCILFYILDVNILGINIITQHKIINGRVFMKNLWNPLPLLGMCHVVS